MIKYKKQIISLIKTGVLFGAFHFIVGLGIFKAMLALNFEPFVAGASAAQIALVFYGLSLVRFNFNILIEMVKGKLNKETVWKGIRLTLLVFLANFAMATLLVKTSFTSDATHGALTSGTLMGTFILPIFIGPIVEEFVFRGAIKKALVDKGGWKPIYYILISSIIFGLPHWQPGRFGIFTVGLTTLMGVIYSTAYIKTDNILIPTISHMFYNGFTITVALTLLPMVEHLL